jgi:dTDP-6-deoxy-L-talose 4-dehydrogenase (NAD+)
MILVTGGSGYVGTAVRDVLNEMQLAHNTITRKSFAENCVEFDLLEGRTSELSDIVNAHSHIIHCAWFVDRDKYLTGEENFDWISASMRLASVADNRKVKHFNGIGTCLEYKSSPLPKNIRSELGADSNYAAAKIATYIGLKQILEKNQIKFAWSRMFHVFGNQEHPKKLMPTINRCILHNEQYEFTASNQIIDLSHIIKIAQDLVNITAGEKQGAFNVCSGTAKTIREVATEIAGEAFARKYFKFSDESTTRNNLAGERFV